MAVSNNQHLIEPASDMIVAYIRANIEPVLIAIQADRNSVVNRGVPLPLPREYFISKNQQALQTPSVFVIPEKGDFKKSRGANFVCATARYGVACVVQGQTSDIATRVAWRYQAAFSKLLDNLSLTSTDGTFRIVVITQAFEFSEDYTVSTQKGDAAEIWRKGFKLNCDVEFYEAK